jgi:hypothetical protein
MTGQFRSVRIKSREEFDWVVEHLTHEAHRARKNWDFVGAIEKAQADYSLELNQTPEFWEVTRRAHSESLVLRLGRLYDPNAIATSLGNLLWTLKENSSGAGTEFPASIADLDVAELNRDIAEVSAADPTVKKLLRLRNENLAHRGTQHVTKGTFKSLPTLDRDELSQLLARALGVLDKYRERLGYRTFQGGHHIVEEFQTLISLLRTGLESKKS